jgi:hypothetical protein
VLIEQTKIDEINEDNAQITLQNAEKALEAAGALVKKAELHVQKETLLMQIAQISLKKADSMTQAQAQAEKAAKARAAAAKAKVKAAKAGLDAKLALLLGTQRRGVEAGRIRSGLDRPAVRPLDITGYALNKARRNYANALHNALEAYRELVRYCLAMFFSTGEQQLPEFIRPDLLTGGSVLGWHQVLSDWQKKLETKVKDLNIRGKIAVKTEVFHWDLTLEQIAALTSPSGLILQVAPQVNREEILLEVPQAFFIDNPDRELGEPAIFRQGPLAEAALEFFRENKLHLTDQAEFDHANPNQPRLFDTGEKKWRLSCTTSRKRNYAKKKSPTKKITGHIN